MSDHQLFADIPYRNTPQRNLRLDLRLPAGVLHPPLVMYIPMAGMRGCAKKKAPVWLVEHGFALASIECRVSSEAIAPAPVHDCKAAVRWLRRHAADYGYDGDAIGAWGHSAGGLLAALLATSGDAPQLDEELAPNISSRVQAACDECGAPHDMTYFGRPEVQLKYAVVAANLQAYLGGPVQDRLELAHLVSPASYISPRCPPLLLIHGEADELVPVEETRAFHAALVSQRVDAQLRVLSGVGHGWDAALTRDEIVAFFERTLVAS